MTPVLILGTGALACFLGARLARSGRAAVTLAGTWREALDAIDRHGISVEDETGGWSVPVGTALLPGPLPACPVVLVLVKSTQTASVAPAAARSITRGGAVVTLQNGLGNTESLEAAVEDRRVAAGVAFLGATVLGPGQVRGWAGSIVLGEERATLAPVRRLAGLLEASGLPARTTPRIERHVWRKLAVNCAVNPLSALLRVPNGALLVPPARDTVVAAAREVGAVAAARGIAFSGEDPGALALEVARQTAPNRSSMLQDVERGAPTEIEAMNGAVAREGTRLGVPTPINAALWQALRNRERAVR